MIYQKGVLLNEFEEEEEEEETVEIDEKTLSAIVDKTKETLLPEVKTLLESMASDNNATIKSAIEEVLAKRVQEDEAVDKTKLAGIKNAAGESIESAVAKGIEDKKIDPKVAEMSAALRFMSQVKALINGDDEASLKKINRYNLATQIDARRAVEAKGGMDAVAKTGYANEATAADGAVLIPDAEFVTTVFDNLPKYGVAFSDADVRNTDRTAVRVISLDSGLTFFATSEAGVKTAAKLLFSKNEVSLQKYAVIVPATDEFTDDAAIDYWNLVTRELTRAYAKKADEIVFTDPTGSASGSGGITNQAGVLTHTIGAGFDWDDLLIAQSKTEDDLDESNNKWYMRKETWYALVMKKGTTNDHYIAGSLNTATGWVANPNTPTTPWGAPVKFTRVLPTFNAVSANDGFAVYGDLSNYLLYNKRGMAIKMLTEATILDADNVSTNLATQDISAMRAVVRMLGILPKGNRTKFVVVGTGTVS